MNEPKENIEKVEAAVDVLLQKKQQGQLQGDKNRNSLSELLRQRISDLKTLNSDISIATIASELTKAGCRVSVSTVQRVLQGATPKRKPRTPHPTDVTKSPTKVTSKPLPITLKPEADASLDAEALLRKMQEEEGTLITPQETKRIATLKP